MELLGVQCAEFKEGTSAVLLQSGLDEKWWADSMECYVIAICETLKISCLIGRHPMKGGSEIPFNGPVFPFGAMVEYHPIFAKNLSRLHPFGAEILPGIFLAWKCVAHGENLERRRIGRRR